MKCFRIKATNSTTILRMMRTINLLLATATIVAGLLAWIMGYVTSFQKVIAGIYIMYESLFINVCKALPEIDSLPTVCLARCY